MKAQDLIDNCDEIFDREELATDLTKQQLADKNITKLLMEDKK